MYQSVSIQPYSPAAGTGLSSHELNQPGTYKDVKDTSAVVMFKALQSSESQFLFDAAAKNKNNQDVYYMAWTTTPWTLPSNLGSTVGPNYDYICTAHHANDNAETLILNLTRGSGYNGLNGIPPKNGKIIRPRLS